jgi:hypothetical protein
MPVIPAMRRQRQKDCEFKASLGFIERSCLKIKQKQKTPPPPQNYIL